MWDQEGNILPLTCLPLFEKVELMQIYFIQKSENQMNLLMQGSFLVWESESDVGSGGKHSAPYLPPSFCCQTIGQDSSNNSSQLNQKILSFQTNFKLISKLSDILTKNCLR